MGDRALVIFTDGMEVSPTTYLHWSGTAVPALLKTHAELMADRKGDISYAAARFIGICHGHVDGNLSLGVFETSDTVRAAVKLGNADTIKNACEAESHGDAGVVIVDCNTFDWYAHGGYLGARGEPGGDR